jgi:hypothetical protein
VFEMSMGEGRAGVGGKQDINDRRKRCGGGKTEKRVLLKK